MKKQYVKVIAVFFTLCMMIGIVYPKTIHAQSGPTIQYNVSNKVMPYIYSKGQMIKTSSSKETILPEGATYLYFYFLPSVAEIDRNQIEINVDGKQYTAKDISWNPSGSYVYATLYLSTALKADSKITADFSYNAIPNFAIRARKNATGSFTDQVEKLIQANPTRYELYNADRSLVFTGTINTVDSWNNFVHWKLTTGSGNYFKDGDDSKIWNLPNGHYTVSETYGGEKMFTTDTGSTTVYLNASLSPKKDAYGNLSYTFDVNQELVNTWMNDYLNNNQSNSAFFGFYTETEKETYTLSFDGNGGNGTMQEIADKNSNTTVQLPTSTFHREGYIFTGWNTVANPSDGNPGTAYADKANYTFTEKNETLYAQWIKQSAVLHSVYTDDKISGKLDAVVGMNKTVYDHDDLAYGKEVLDQAAQAYIKDQKYEDAEYTGYTIQVKEKDEAEWKDYQEGMKLQDGTQVRYLLHIVEKENPQPPVDPTDPEEPVIPTPPVEPVNPIIPINPITPVIPTTPTLPIAPLTPRVNLPQTVTPPTENVTPNETPKSNGNTETVKNNETPKAKGIGGSWALINLIAAVLTVLLGVIALLSKHAKEEEIEDNEQLSDESEVNAYRRRRWTKVMSVIIALVSVMLFIITEDITLPMVLVDEWTIWMVVIAFVQVMILLLTKKWKAKEQKETVQQTN